MNVTTDPVKFNDPKLLLKVGKFKTYWCGEWWEPAKEILALAGNCCLSSKISYRAEYLDPGSLPRLRLRQHIYTMRESGGSFWKILTDFPNSTHLAAGEHDFENTKFSWNFCVLYKCFQVKSRTEHFCKTWTFCMASVDLLQFQRGFMATCFYRLRSVRDINWFNFFSCIFSFLQLIKSDATLASIMPTEACDIFIFLKSRNILETFKMWRDGTFPDIGLGQSARVPGSRLAATHESKSKMLPSSNFGRIQRCRHTACQVKPRNDSLPHTQNFSSCRV